MKLRPKAGYAFVKLDSKWLDCYGDIVLPENVRLNPGKSGIVQDYMPYPDAPVIVFEHGKRVTRNMARYNPIYNELTGKRVVCDCGQLMSPSGKQQDSLYVVRLEHIALIMDAATRIEQQNVHYNGVPRCKWCKSAGEDNMILDNLGYCPQCKRNENGQHIKHRSLGPASDELSYAMNRSQLDALDHARLSRKIVTFGK